MKYVGLDLGSSSIKGALLDVTECSIGAPVHVACPEPVSGLPAGHFELDPLAVLTCVERVLAALLAEGSPCHGVVLCSQMAGVVLVDDRGRLLTNYLSWRDQRSREPHPSGKGSYQELLQGRLTTTELQELGNELKPGSAPSLLFWLAEQNRLPENAVPLSIADFVASRLCHAEPCSQYTNAGGGLNLESGGWHWSVFEKLGLHCLKWPRLCPATTPVGHVTRGSNRLQWYPAIGDHQCALLGTHLGPGELSLNISTGSQVSLLSGQPRPGSHQTRPYFDGQLVHTVTHLPAGRSLNVLVDLLTELARAQGHTLHDPWRSIADAAAAAPDTELDVDLAFFVGPLGDHGKITSITLDNLTVGTLFRAAFRSMARNYRSVAATLAAPVDWDRIVISGGLAQRLTLLREFVVDQFRCPCRFHDTREDTLEGLLILASVISGRASNFAAASQWVQSRRTDGGELPNDSSS